MTAVDLMFLCGFILAAALSFGDPRAWLWLAFGAVNYAISATWWRTGAPSPIVMSAALDAMVALGIYIYGRQRWEMWLRWTFLAMLAVNLYALGSLAPSWPVPFPSLSHNAYSYTLEVLNGAALLWIGFNGLTQMVGGYDVGATVRRSRGAFRWAVAALHAPRQPLRSP